MAANPVALKPTADPRLAACEVNLLRAIGGVSFCPVRDTTERMYARHLESLGLVCFTYIGDISGYMITEKGRDYLANVDGAL